MAEYKTPGVYVEEASFSAKAIEGVSTHVAGFAGLTARGDVDDASPLLTSFAEFERAYGGCEWLCISRKRVPSYLALAVRAFFDNGGKRLHVARVPATAVAANATRETSEAAWRKALGLLREVRDLSLLAAPGASVFAGPALTPADVNQWLIESAEAAPVRRFAVLDPPPAQGLSEIQAFRGKFDSKYAALYYPWIRTANHLAGMSPAQAVTLHQPPSGFVCGIYARVDVERGVFKAPANEVVHGALGLQSAVNGAEQDVLNPLGINVIRRFDAGGIRVWGARTLSADREWKYVSVRRYFIYLEASIDRGTQWAVFEPNGEALWVRVRASIEGFLLKEWRGGALAGIKPEEAFFVKCDRTTMTQNDLDNGRLVCMIGVAALKPAEFMILVIVQHTSSSVT